MQTSLIKTHTILEGMLCSLQLPKLSEEETLLCLILRVQKETFNDECPSKVTEAEDTANPDVARWIEERDILLETGVYTQNDFTIQQLDQKIKACLK